MDRVEETLQGVNLYQKAEEEQETIPSKNRLMIRKTAGTEPF